MAYTGDPTLPDPALGNGNANQAADPVANEAIKAAQAAAAIAALPGVVPDPGNAPVDFPQDISYEPTVS